MNIKRSIRLKEFMPNTEKVHYPSKEYLVKAPQILKNEAFFQRVNQYGAMEYPCDFVDDFIIVFLGDSFIENIFVKESERTLNLLQKYFLKSGKSVKIYNFGTSGSTGLGLLNLYLNKIISIKPDVIVYIQPSCDFSALIYKDGYYNNSKYFSNILPSLENEKFYYETIEDNLDQLSHNINLLAKSCNINKTQLFIATCCSNSSKRQLKMMNDVIRNNVSLGYDIIDLDLIVSRDEKYFYDKQHINSCGSQLISKILYKALGESVFSKSNSLIGECAISYFENNILNSLLIINNDFERIVSVERYIKTISLIMEFEDFDKINNENTIRDYIDLSINIEAYYDSKIVKKIVRNIKHPIGYRLEQSIQCILNDYIDNLKINIFTTYPKDIKVLSLSLMGVG